MKMNRRNFLSGVLTGGSAVLVSGFGLKSFHGDYNYLCTPVGTIPLLPVNQEEMKVILLGTGMPKPDLVRSKPAQLIVAGKKVFLIDCGAGTVDRLLRAGIPPERIVDVFITHHHSDHNAGFADLFISSWTGSQFPGRNEPLNVYGPNNTKAIIGKTMESLAWDIALRIEQAKYDPRGAQISYFEKDEGVVYDQQGVKVTAFPVDHGIVKPAIGYQFEYRGKKIVISGDTRPCENMVHYSDGADVLVHEAYSPGWYKRALQHFPGDKGKLKAMIEGASQYHSSALDVAEIATRAGVKHLVFTHLMPAPSPVWYFENAWAKGVSDIFRGNVTVGRDLMSF